MTAQGGKKEKVLWVFALKKKGTEKKTKQKTHPLFVELSTGATIIQ